MGEIVAAQRPFFGGIEKPLSIRSGGASSWHRASTWTLDRRERGLLTLPGYPKRCADFRGAAEVPTGSAINFGSFSDPARVDQLIVQRECTSVW